MMRSFLVVCALFTAAHAVSAQQTTPQPNTQPSAGSRSPQDEKRVAVNYVPALRLDLIAGSVTAVHAGASVVVPVSNYFGIGGTAGVGLSEEGFSGRADLFARFSLDPYRQYPWEPYFGAGGTVRMDSGGPGTRSYLLAFVGLNGPKTGKIAPGVELGFGGGLRLGVTLRWAQ